ncbi:MAG: KAP P-loop domain-containing [Desulfobulbaceae bacterium]|nr:MAG: KAP P-loop domain-containing [Desulfobulbaceae bacterium]
MEFKARKITIDPSDPYRDDTLSRKENIDNMSLLLRNISTPIVLSVNAPWGQGKTTFLEMLHADLMNNHCNSIYFSAWETDFASDPLLAFLGEMSQGLNTLINGDDKKNEAWEKAKKAGVHILKKGIPALIKIGTAGIIDVDKSLEDEASKLMEGISKDIITEYSRNKDEIIRFKDSIAKLLCNEDGTKTKLFIIIDELDRCRPTYAIEFLERIKHLLDIEGLVFVLALDKQQLSHSVKGIYGADFDALGYLRRFIDIEYSLPECDIGKFIDQLYQTFGFDDFFERRTKYPALRYEVEHLKNVFKMFASALKLSLREMEQIFSKMNLVIHSTNETSYLYPALLAYLLVVKESNRTIYLDYVRKESTPEKIIEYLYELIPRSTRNESFECALIEGFLIAAKNSAYNSTLGLALDKHNECLADEQSDDKQRQYSHRIIEIVKKPTESFGYGVNLSNLVSRIEMSESFKFA